MHFLVKFFPEITIKSRQVRLNFIKQLRININDVLFAKGIKADIRSKWDYITVALPEDCDNDAAWDAMQNICGIVDISEIIKYEFTTIEQAAQDVMRHWEGKLADNSFVVRMKRSGKHEFRSPEAERQIGGYILHHCETGGVDLHNPDLTINVELKQNELFVVTRKAKGIGGFPMGTQDAVLSLISGGFDSTVASYLLNKRGVKTHYCFFNLGGNAHEIGVKQVSHYLWEKFGCRHSVNFITVPFDGVVTEILENVQNSQMGVILKRMMLRAASAVAKELELPALVTGEAVAQVSSQTMTNLAVIDKVTEMLVLRPLIATDKPDIIKMARDIGTEDFAASMPEYCGVISVNPTTKAKIEKIEEEEGKFNFAVLENAIASKEVLPIERVLESNVNHMDVEEVPIPSLDDVVIDIRHPSEQEQKPLHLTNNEILTIPFFKLNTQMATLDHKTRYLLYCEKGTMSKLHAHHMKTEGFSSVAVYTK